MKKSGFGLMEVEAVKFIKIICTARVRLDVSEKRF